MKPADVRDFCDRDWRLLEGLKSDCWLEQKSAMSPTDAFRLGDELRKYARGLKPDWPNAAERESDLQSHIRVAEMLLRASTNSSR